jgi:hypothetical protein
MPIIIPSSGDAAEILVGNRIKLPNGNLIVPPTNYLSKFFDATQSLGTISTGTVSQTGNRTAPNASWAEVATVQFTIVQATSSALRGTTNYILDGGSTSVTGSVLLESPVFTLDGVDLGKPISVSFDSVLNDVDGAYDVCIVRYNSSGIYQETIPIAGNASTATVPSAKIPIGTGTFRGFFIARTTASDLYSLRFRRLAASASLRIDTLYVGPQSQLSSAAITDWQSYTPTANGISLTDIGTQWRRVGDSIEVHSRFTATSVTGASTFQFNLPSGLTIDSTKLTSSGVAKGAFSTTNVSAGAAIAYYAIPVGGTTYVGVGRKNASTDNGLALVTNGTIITNGDQVSLSFMVPVVGWSSNVTMAERAVEEYASDDGSADVFGVSGSLVPNVVAATGLTSRDFTFQGTRQSTDFFSVEIMEPNGGWEQVASYMPWVRGNNANSNN